MALGGQTLVNAPSWCRHLPALPHCSAEQEGPHNEDVADPRGGATNTVGQLDGNAMQQLRTSSVETTTKPVSSEPRTIPNISRIVNTAPLITAVSKSNAKDLGELVLPGASLIKRRTA
jgi:hypothetical protein